MNYCRVCGEKVNGESKCPKCGFEEVSKEEENNDEKNTVENQQVEDIQENNLENKDELHNKKKKSMLIIAGSVLAVLVVIFASLNKHYSNSNIIVKKFKDAVSQNSVQKLQNVIYCDDSRLTLDDKNTKVILEYFKNNPAYLDKVISDLQNQSDKIKSVGLIAASGKKSSGILYIQNVGKSMLFFPKYKIAVKPVYVNLTCKVKGVVVKLNNEECCKVDNDKFEKQVGPLLPGIYKLSAEFSNNFIKKSYNQNIDLVKDNGEIPQIDIFTDLIYVNINSDVKNAEVYVNGKNTGLTVDKATTFGPVDDNSVIYGVAKSQGKVLKSQEFRVADNKDIYLDFSAAVQEEEDFKSQLYNLVNSYCENFAYAVNYNNFSYIEYYLEGGSPLYNMQKKAIGDINSANITEDFITMEILSYKFDKTTNEGTVVCKEVYDITKQYSDTSTKTFENTYKFIRRLDGTLVLTELIKR